MKRYTVFIIIMLFAVFAAGAQEVGGTKPTDVIAGKDVPTDAAIGLDTLVEAGGSAECSLPLTASPYTRGSYMGKADDTHSTDSLNLPLLTSRTGMPLLPSRTACPLMSAPYHSWWGIDTWNLHSGLNVSLGASVSAAFGKGAYSGVAFSQELSMMYAVPVTDRLSFAVGGWVNNVNWSHDRYTDAGLSAVLGYRFNEHWEAYAYVRKSLVDKRVPYRFATMGELGDRIGASVKYNFSPSFSVQVSVEGARYGSPRWLDTGYEGYSSFDGR